MWRENAKSALLIVLVALSIYLSLRLWEGLPPAEAPAAGLPVGGTYWGAGRDPVALLAPSRLVLYRGPAGPALLYPGSPEYEKAWAGALDVLQQLGSLGPGQLTGENAALPTWKTGEAVTALELVFLLPIEPALWGPVLDYPPGFELPWPVKRVLILPGRTPTLFLCGPAAGEVRAFRVPDAAAELGTALKALARASLVPARELKAPLPLAGRVLVPTAGFPLPVLRLGGETVEPEVVAGSFFADLSLTRRIRERDGATIYSDGRRGVRVRPDGGVEYSAPEVMAGVPLPAAQALERAARFTTQHGGWPAEARLAEFTPVTGPPGSVHYRLTFSQYWNGLPTLTPAVELELSDLGVGGYRRSVGVAAGRAGWVTVNAKGLEEAILKQGGLGKGEAVADVYPAYQEQRAATGEKLLVPGWVVETARGRRLWLRAEGGGRS